MTKRYIGTKIVTAFPQANIAGPGEGEDKPGYGVIYEDGYQSWSPASAFEPAYRAIEGDYQALTFGDALHMLKLGKRVARTGWNGKGMWLAMSPGNPGLPADKFWAGPNREYAESIGGQAPVHPCITMKTADGGVLMGWLASQTDMLAEDWMVLP